MLQPILGMELSEIQEALGPGLPAYRARQAYQAVYRGRVESAERMLTLPAELRARLAAHPFGLPAEAGRFDSADGTRRYLLRLADDRTVETVLMPEASRDTICISTQIGCAVDCRFCLTARMGLERNLTAGEIVGQVLHVVRAHALDPRQARVNVVLMGMGEPLLNLANVLRATRLLADPEGVGLSPRRITLSTAGIVPRMAELGREPVRPRLAVSLNASTDEQRRELMPITRKYPLRELMETCRAYPLRPWERLSFEYVLLGGVNDSDADARRVVRLLAHLKAKVNLIPLNPGPGIPFVTPAPERVRSFQDILKNSLPCFVRQPRGRDVYAACGQLKRMSVSGGNQDGGD
jgi:23S rRNA (adenine2503-C2)-methyltransferase